MITRRRFLTATLAERLGALRIRSFSASALGTGVLPGAGPRPALTTAGSDPASSHASVGVLDPQSPRTNGTDFARRASGALRAWDFSRGLGPKITPGTVVPFPTVLWYPGSSNNPTLDTSHGLSAVRFDVPGKSLSNAGGEWVINFSDDLKTQFGEGDEFFVQWRQRFNQAYIDAYITMAARNAAGAWIPNGQPSGIKQVIMAAQDTPTSHFDSCVALSLVATSYGMHKFPILYQACGWSIPLTDKMPGRSYDFRLQNQRPPPYCTYLQANTRDTSVPNGCFGYVPDEWMTFQISVKLGTLGALAGLAAPAYLGSRVRMWGAREGKPSELLIDLPWNIHAGSPVQTYGKMWFGPYMTNKDPSVDHPLIQTWIAEFIVSRKPILDPVVLTRPPGAAAKSPARPIAASLASLPSGRIRNLGIYYDPAVFGDKSRTDYSTIVYDPTGKQMLFFGGEHGPSKATDIRAFSLATLKWSSLYPSTTPKQIANPANFDATLGRFIDTNQPQARHTFHAVLMIGRRYYMLTTSHGGMPCWYDLDTRTWTWSKTRETWYYASGVALDPRTGRVVIVGTDRGASDWMHVYLYDPVSDTVEQLGNTGGTCTSLQLAYLPERDVFLAIKDDGDVWEIALDREHPRVFSASRVATSGTLPRVYMNPTAWARDLRTGIFIGCVQNGVAQNYDPAARKWSSLQLRNEDGSLATAWQAYYCLALDLESGCVIFLARDGNTYAWRP